MSIALKVEYAHQRKIRARNKVYYRINHLPIWIFVFFLAPGPLTFDLFANGGGMTHWLWLLLVLAGTAIAGYFGQLPGVEPQPYILRFNEDKPNPLYRRICYTFAWNALLSFALLNLAGLVTAVLTRRWLLKQIYSAGYLPVFLMIMLAGLGGLLPRARRSTKGEGFERRYFYGAVWSVTLAQTTLLLLWKTLPKTHATDIEKLTAYLAVLLAVAIVSTFGLLPRTRPILPGELMIAD
jgi:hypothetical protein